MAGISSISLISYSYNNPYLREQELTASTEARLRALGVDTSGIRTEAEGQAKLKIAETERWTNGGTNGVQKEEKKAEDENLIKARELADELDISYNNDENVTEISARIQKKLDEMKVEANGDFDKNADIGSYQKRLDEIEAGDMSQANLETSMSMSASYNIAFHGLL